ncbi:RidA family protein [bacterium]|nr:RidA family protein [bacterium]
MKKNIVSTDKAPAAIGPYSQGVKAGGFLFLSGQIPLVPESGEMVAGGIEEQTKQVMLNMEAILKSQGLGLDHVVKTTIFLTDLTQFVAVNDIYGSFFQANPPARSTIQVAALPKGALVEIEAVILLD